MLNGLSKTLLKYPVPVMTVIMIITGLFFWIAFFSDARLEVDFSLEQMYRGFGNSFENGSSRLAYSPPMNVNETVNDYLIMMDLPGVKKKDVEVNICNGVLTVSGERKTSERGDENNQIWHEPTYGTFSRSLELTSAIIEEKVKAKYKDGVLNITIPKTEEIKPAVKQIAVS